MASTSEYWVGDVIGEGSFGIVVYGRYKQEMARDQSDQLHVAIKCIDKNILQRQPSMAMAVVQEQRLLKRLKEKQQRGSAIKDKTSSSEKVTTPSTVANTLNNRKNNFIVDLYASFHDTECVYLVLECCCGGTLQDLFDYFIDADNNFSLQEGAPTTDKDDSSTATTSSTTTTSLLEATQYYGIQLIMGTSFIHSCSIIHCDLKPSNILLTNYGCIKISDFGSSIDLLNSNTQKRVGANCPTASPDSNTPSKFNGRMITPRGTAAYAAPELNRHPPAEPRQSSIDDDDDDNNATPNGAVDLWSLGCILYACLLMESHHQSPFDRGSEATSIEAQKKFCSITDADIRQSKLFGKDPISLAYNVKAKEENKENEEKLQVYKGLIAALLHPKADKRIEFAKRQPHHVSLATESSSSVQKQRDLSSITNVVEDDLMMYPNLHRSIAWGMDEVTPQQALPFKTDFLPPTPTWWIKNSRAASPLKSTNSSTGMPTTTTEECHDSCTSNVLMDGSIGWSAFLV